MSKIRIVRTDPIRILIPSDQQLRQINPMGCILRIHRDEISMKLDEALMTIQTKDTKPYDSKRESYKETVSKVLEQFKVKQDHIREIYAHELCGGRFNDGSLQQCEIEVNEKLFQKATKYDRLIDRLTNKKKLPNGNIKGELNLK